MAEINKKDYLTGWVKTAIALNLIFIAITAAIFISKGYFNPTSEIAYNQLESFGSFVGGICSSITSLVAIYLVLRTYNSQKEELKETRKIASEQSSTLKIQQFESTYFNMLKMLREIVPTMEGRISDQYMEGRFYLNQLFKYYKEKITKDKGEYRNHLQRLIDSKSKEEKLDETKTFYNKKYDEDIYKVHRGNLAHYYRFVHNILKYVVYSSTLEEESKRKYLSILQAQLSNDELAFILYNSLSDNSLNKNREPEFKEMVDNYGILEHIDKEWVLFDPKYLEEFFPKTNFFILRDNSKTL